MAIYFVDLPVENGESFHSYASLPEGIIIVTDSWCDHQFDVIIN